jgi:hypothetical protein
VIDVEPFNVVNSASTAAIDPTLGFTLIGHVTGKTSATVSNMNQFAAGG